MEKEVTQFTLEDGTAFWVEVDKAQTVRGGSIKRVAINLGQLVLQVNRTLEQTLDQMQPVVSKVVSRLKSELMTPANEVEITFGLKLNAEAGVVFASVDSEVTCEAKLKWAKVTLNNESENNVGQQFSQSCKKAISLFSGQTDRSRQIANALSDQRTENPQEVRAIRKQKTNFPR